MNVIFYKSFSKRHNSTKIPTSTGDTYSVSLKKNTSFYSPSFLLEMTDVDLTYNYCQWEGRYYYVNDITLVRANIFDFSCTFDALATYRSNILSYNAFVARASGTFDALIPDTLLSERTAYLDQRFLVGDTIADFSTTGSYIIKVVGNASEVSFTGITTFICTAAEIRDILSFLFNSGNFAEEFTDAAVKTVFNPFQYIVSLAWTPFATTTVATETANVKLGFWDTGVTAHVITNNVLSFNASIPFIEPVYDETDFRRYLATYTSWHVFFPGAGLREISPMEMADGCYCVYYVDFNSGNSLVRVFNSSAMQIAQFDAKMVVEIQIGQQSQQLETLAQIAGGIGITLGTGGIGGLVMGGTQYFSGAMQLMQPTPSTTGTNASMAVLSSIPWVVTYLQELDSAEFPVIESGRPLMKQVTLSSLSGQYVQCLNASVPITGNETAKETINNTLNGGVYIE